MVVKRRVLLNSLQTYGELDLLQQKAGISRYIVGDPKIANYKNVYYVFLPDFHLCMLGMSYLE